MNIKNIDERVSKLLNNEIKIGNVIIKNPVFLAPMAGVTDLPYRIICSEFNPGLIYTEMISIKALHFNDEKTKDLMIIREENRPVAMQIFTKEPEIIKSVHGLLNSHNNDILDINMGCPAPKIVNNGEGSALVKDPELVRRIVAEAVKWSDKPVTVKIRKGWDENLINAVEIAKIAESEGASLVAVHGRTREEFYSGKADRDIIKRVKDSVSIPVIGNGDIFSAEDSKSMMDETGCDGIMIGRGLEGNPWIIREAKEYLKSGRLISKPTLEERRIVVLKHLELLVKIKGERRGVLEMRKHAAWYLKGIHGGNKYKNLINSTADYGKIVMLINEAFKIRE